MSGPSGGVAVVTGATGGMGQVIALELARADMQVVTIARDPRRAEDLHARITASGRGALDVIRGDLSNRAGVTAAATAIAERGEAVRVLVNNAGAHYRDRRLSADGVEMHIAVDYLASYGLTVRLEQQLARGRARVVNVVSDSLRDTRQVKLIGKPRPATVEVRDLDDLTRLNAAAGFVPFQAYARAKLLTVIAGYALAHALEAEGITVNAVHPGIVATDIIDDIMPKALRPLTGVIRRTLLTPEQGAAAALRLATDRTVQGVTGRYFLRDTDTATPEVSYDRTAQTQLIASSNRFFRIS